MSRILLIVCAGAVCLLAAFLLVSTLPDQFLLAVDRIDTKVLLTVLIALSLAVLIVLVAHFLYLPTLRRFVTNIARIFVLTLPMTSCVVPYAVTTMTMDLNTQPSLNVTFDPGSIPHVQIWIVGATIICLSMIIRFFADYFKIEDR